MTDDQDRCEWLIRVVPDKGP